MQLSKITYYLYNNLEDNKEYVKMVSTKNCKYCEFKDKSDLCDRNKK